MSEPDGNRGDGMGRFMALACPPPFFQKPDLEDVILSLLIRDIRRRRDDTSSGYRTNLRYQRVGLWISLQELAGNPGL